MAAARTTPATGIKIKKAPNTKMSSAIKIIPPSKKKGRRPNRPDLGHIDAVAAALDVPHPERAFRARRQRAAWGDNLWLGTMLFVWWKAPVDHGHKAERLSVLNRDGFCWPQSVLAAKKEMIAESVHREAVLLVATHTNFERLAIDLVPPDPKL